jgi:hypothetical protein
MNGAGLRILPGAVHLLASGCAAKATVRAKLQGGEKIHLDSVRRGVGIRRWIVYLLGVMRALSESLALALAPIAGIALLCAAPVMASQVAAPGKTRLQPQITTDATPAGFRVKSKPLAGLQPITLDVSRFAFTAPGRMASSQMQAVEREFSFTPSGSGSKRGVSLGMTARSVAPTAQRTAAAAPPVDPGITPAGYNFDLAVGYRGFALSGGVTRVDTGIGGRSSEGVDVGLSYAARNWKTGIQASAERESLYLLPRGGTPDPRYAVEASGALALSPQISLGGSVRYRLAPENPTPLDPNKDDRAVFLGGAVAF